MTRKRPEDRIARLVDVATEVFIASQSYQRTQMEDVAKALGVAKGSLYLYVESKEALFDLCVRYADTPRDLHDSQHDMPHTSPGAKETLNFVQARLAGDPAFTELVTLLTRPRYTHPARDIERVVRVLYQALYRHRKSIKLVEAAAQDHPGLSDVWFPNARGQLLELLLPFVERQVTAGKFSKVSQPSIAARHLIETCAFWAMHRHWDPAPQAVEESVVEDAVVELIMCVFLEKST